MTQVNFYSKEQIDEREIGEPTDSASSSGSLWARIKNAVARIVSLETADSNNVKKTGRSTVTGTLEVPTTPPTPTSAVNSIYVNDMTAGVNNIVHKTGNEAISGIKTFNGAIIEEQNMIRRYTNFDMTDPPAGGNQSTCILFTDKNNVEMARLLIRLNANKSTAFQLWVKNANGTTKTVNIVEGDP